MRALFLERPRQRARALLGFGLLLAVPASALEVRAPDLEAGSTLVVVESSGEPLVDFCWTEGHPYWAVTASHRRVHIFASEPLRMGARLHLVGTYTDCGGEPVWRVAVISGGRNLALGR